MTAEVVNENAHLGVTGRTMPKIRFVPAASVRYYRIHFLDDGFPGQRRADGSVYEHPLYPYYVVNDYLKQFARKRKPAVLEAAEFVMAAALKRTAEFNDALVFWYDSDASVSRATHRHYSALTQAYYATMLADLAEASGRRRHYNVLARKFALSLTLATEEGGVMRVRPEGKGIEEVPLAMADLVFNGWLSALAVLSRQPHLIRRSRLARFMDENLDLVESLLPRYDVPGLRNTRYSLSGFAQLRLASSGPSFTLRQPRVTWSAHEAFEVGTDQSSRWQNYLHQDDTTQNADGSCTSRRGTLRINAVLSQLAQENAIEFVAQSAKPATVRVEIAVGGYDPLTTAPVDPKWTTLASLPLGREPRAFRVAIGAAHVAMIGYPTNFQKSLGGVNCNVYHPLHITRLHQLHAYQDRAAFAEYAQRWTGYIAEWSQDPVYRHVMGFDYRRHVPLPLRAAAGNRPSRSIVAQD